MKFRFLLPLVLLLAFAGCTGGDNDPGAQTDSQGGDKFQVVATTGQVGDLVRRLGGEHLDISVMMGPGIDPHLYEPFPSDMIKLDGADLIVYSGLHLEGKLTDVFESIVQKRKSKKVIALTQGLLSANDERLIHPEGFNDLHDPHVWHDVAMWSDCAEYLANQLIEFDPSHAEHYQSNLAQVQKDFQELDAWCKGEIASVPEKARMMVTAHDAFAYFSKAYGLESVGLKGISTEDEVDLGQMQKVANLLVERKVPCVFIESAVPRRIVEALVEECQSQGHSVRIGGELYADAMGPIGSGADDYLGMIRANVETIVSGLVGEANSEVSVVKEGGENDD